MPIPNDDATRRIKRSVKTTEMLLPHNPVRGKRVRRMDDDTAPIVLAEAEIPAGSATSSVVTPGTGTVRICQRGTAPQYTPTTRTETLYNFSPNALATGASPSQPQPLVATLEGDRLVVRDTKGEKGDPGAPGVSGGTGIVFEMTEDLAPSDTEKMAQILNADGTPFSGAITTVDTVVDETARKALIEGTDINVDEIVAQETPAPDTYWKYLGGAGNGNAADQDSYWENVPSDTDVIVVDPGLFIEALGPYISADQPDDTVVNQRGFIGTGPIISNNYLDSGYPGVLIDSMQSFATLIEVELLETVSSTGDYGATFLSAFGSNWHERLPIQSTIVPPSGPSTFGVVVSNKQGVATGVKAGERWVAMQQVHAAGRPYVLISPSKDFRCVIGTATSTLVGTGDCTVGSLTTLQGTELTVGTIQPTTDVAVRVDNGDKVMAFFDRSISTTFARQWRLVSSRNLVPWLKGIDGFDPGGSAHQYLANIGGGVKWQNQCEWPVTDVFVEDGLLKLNREYDGGAGCTDHEETIASFGGDIRTVWVNSTISAATVNSGGVVYGTGQGILCDTTGAKTAQTVDIVSSVPTAIVGSAAVPLAISMYKLIPADPPSVPNDVYLVISDKDFRGGPGFNADVMQIWIHEEFNENFNFVTYCTTDVVTRVWIQTNGSNATLVFDKRAWDSCTVTTEDVKELGDCIEPT